MDAVRILRQLWERRLPVACGFLLATVAGSSIAYHVGVGIPPTVKSREYQVGVATVDVLVDSGLSQVADLGGGRLRTDLASLSTRAQLLANLLATSLLRERIAVRAGVDPRQFHARVLAASTDTAPRSPSPLARPIGRRANTLTVSVRDLVPIISVDTQAADAATASRIATAATTELKSYQMVAAPTAIPNARRLILKTLGQPRSGTVVRGRRRINGLVAFVLVLGVWCTLLIVKEPIVRRWREAAREEEEEEASDDEPVGARSSSRGMLAPLHPASSPTQPGAEPSVPSPLTPTPRQHQPTDVQRPKNAVAARGGEPESPVIDVQLQPAHDRSASNAGVSAWRTR